MTPFVQRLILTLVAAALVAAASLLDLDADARAALVALATGLVGAGLIKRPGDQAPPKGGVALFALLFALPFLQGCPQPGPSPKIVDSSIDCSRRSLTQMLGQVGRVNDCLTQETYRASASCLGGIVADVGLGIVACVVDSQRQRFAAAAEARPESDVAERAAQNGRKWLQEHDIQLQP